jgi:hypothetical protein
VLAKEPSEVVARIAGSHGSIVERKHELLLAVKDVGEIGEQLINQRGRIDQCCQATPLIATRTPPGQQFGTGHRR